MGNRLGFPWECLLVVWALQWKGDISVMVLSWLQGSPVLRDGLEKYIWIPAHFGGGGRLRVTWIGNYLQGILSHPMQLAGLDGAPQKGFCLPVLAMAWPHPTLSCSQYWQWSVQIPVNSPISDPLPQPCLNLSSTKSRASHRLPPPQPLRFGSLNFIPTPFKQALSQTW